MNKYLIEILKIQNSIILPGFGALMVASAKTGKIVFNPLLKFNDGTLAKFIAEKEGIDEQAALNTIAKFVREIETELNKGNSYDVFQFGKFFKDKDGKIDFTMEGEGIKKEVQKETAPAKKVDSAETGKKVDDKKAEKEKKEAEKKAIEDKKAADKKAADEKKIAEKKAEEAKKEAEKKAAADKKVAEIKKEVTEKSDETKAVDKAIDKNTFIPVKDIKDKVEETSVKKTEATKESTQATSIKQKVDSAADTVKKDIKAAPIKEIQKTDTKQEKNTFTPKDEKSDKQKPSVKDRYKKEKVKKDPKDKKKKSKMPLIIIIVVLLGGGGTAAFLFQDEIKSFLFTGVHEDDKGDNDEHEENNHDNSDEDVVDEDITDEDVTDEDISDENITEENIVEEDIVEEDIVDEPVADHSNNASSGGSYHIIGNAFSDKGNAESYVSTMKSKGYSAKILGRFDNLYLVSIKSYDSRGAAESGISSVSSDADGAWVFKY